MDYDKITTYISIGVSAAVLVIVYLTTGLSELVANANTIVSILSVIAVLVFFFVIALVCSTVLYKVLGRKHQIEMDAIIDAYDETEDAQAYHQSLVKMENRPKFKSDKDKWYYHIAEALNLIDRKEDALRTLGLIVTHNKSLKNLVEELKDEIDPDHILRKDEDDDYYDEEDDLTEETIEEKESEEINFEEVQELLEESTD